MVSFRIEGTPEQVQPLVPAERARIAELRAAGVIESLQLSAAGDRGWIVMSAANADAVQSALDSLPMAHILSTEIVELRAI